MIDLSHRTVGIDDISLLLLGAFTETTSLTNIPLIAFITFECYGIGIHDIATDFHRTLILWDNETVAFTKHNVFIATRMFQGFTQLYSYSIDITHIHLFHRDRVLTILTQSDGLHRHLEAGTLSLVHPTLQSSSFNVGIISNAASPLDKVAQTLVLLL